MNASENRKPGNVVGKQNRECRQMKGIRKMFADVNANRSVPITHLLLANIGRQGKIIRFEIGINLIMTLSYYIKSKYYDIQFDFDSHALPPIYPNISIILKQITRTVRTPALPGSGFSFFYVKFTIIIALVNIDSESNENYAA